MTDHTISPLRRRMIDDMTIRGFASKTHREATFAWSGISPPFSAALRTGQVPRT